MQAIGFRDLDSFKEATLLLNINKTDDEIDKYMIDITLNDIDKFNYILKYGNFIQKTAIIKNLIILIKDNSNIDTTVYIFPQLIKFLAKTDQSIQLEAANTFEIIINNSLLDSNKIGATLYPIAEAKTENLEVYKAWINIFNLLTPLVNNKLQGQMVNFVLNQVDNFQTTNRRCIAVTGISSLAKVMPIENFKVLFMDKIIALCLDTEPEMRRAICDQLGVVARVLGASFTLSTLASELVELSKDEDYLVRVRLLSCFASLIDFLPSTFIDKYATPLFISLCKYYVETPNLFDSASISMSFEVFCKNFGQYLKLSAPEIVEFHANVAVNIDSRFLIHFPIIFSAFKILIRPMAPLNIKRLAAFNFPAMVFYFQSMYSTYLHEIMLLLAQDTDLEIKKIVASSLLDIATIIKPQRALFHLKDIYISFLKDSESVIQNVSIEKLEGILKLFKASTDIDVSAKLTEVFNSLLYFDSNLKNNWRGKEILYSKVPIFTTYFPFNLIMDKMFPILFSGMHNSAEPVKLMASLAVTHFIRSQTSNYRRSDLISRCINEFAMSRYYHDRITFLNMFIQMLKIFSKRWIKTNFLNAALDLCGIERIDVVKLKIVSFFINIKSIFIFPVDQPQVDRINSYLVKYSKDASPELQCEREYYSINMASRFESLDLDDAKKETEEVGWDDADMQDIGKRINLDALAELEKSQLNKKGARRFSTNNLSSITPLSRRAGSNAPISYLLPTSSKDRSATFTSSTGVILSPTPISPNTIFNSRSNSPSVLPSSTNFFYNKSNTSPTPDAISQVVSQFESSFGKDKLRRSSNNGPANAAIIKASSYFGSSSTRDDPSKSVAGLPPIKKSVPTPLPLVSSVVLTASISKLGSFNEKDKGNLIGIKTPVAISTNKLLPKPVVSASSPKPVLSPRESMKPKIGVGAPIPVPRKTSEALPSPINVKKNVR